MIENKNSLEDCHSITKWVEVTIGEVSEVIAGGTPKAGEPSNFAEPGTAIPWLTPADLSGYSQKDISYGRRDLSQRGYDSSSAKLMPKGSLLFSSRAPIGYVVIAKNQISTNQGFKNFVFTTGVDSSYAYYYLRSIRELAESLGTGTTFKEISGTTAKKLPFVLPPLAEQKVIADKLDTLLAQVETTKARLDRIPQILKTFRQSVLAAAVSGELTEDWRNSSKEAGSPEQIFAAMKQNKKSAWLIEHEKSYRRNGKEFLKEKVLKRYIEPSDKFQDEFGLTTISKIPKQWVATNLDNVSVAVTGKTPSTSDKDNWEGDIPFISPSQILANGKVIAPERYITPKGSTKAPLLPEGAVMIVCIGTIGKVGLLGKESAFNQQINALIPSSSIKSKYLFYWAQTLHAWLNKTSSAVVNAAIINKSRLCEAPCPLPSIEEQTEIVRRVEELLAFSDRIEEKANAALERVNNLTQSILAKAFRGELTADWRSYNSDLISGDNSAEVLLAKIKDEREKIKKQAEPKRTGFKR